ncbi:unnamed protein product [Triticum aestivum]|uniref:Uncharacterized protein n=1 Tax=Triticum aestivum TaxID=4565 RepID=A0A7H4LHV9_WHEAT|nr:unnamed protein product [Triticum aestivum]
MVNHGKEKARFLLSICSPTAAAFPELGELELSLPVVDLLSAMLPASPDHPLSLSRDSLPGAAAPAQPKAAGRSYAAARSLPLFLGTGLWPRRSLPLSPSSSRSNGLVHKSGSTSHSSIFRSSPSTTTAPPHAHRTRAQVLLKSALGVIAFLTGAPDYEDGQLDTKRYGEQYASKGEDVDLMLLPEQIPSYRDLVSLCFFCSNFFSIH